jgi:transposase
MAHEFLTYSTDQAFLLPPNPRDWLPDGHLAFQVIDVVDELDLGLFVASYGRDGRGAPSFSPVMMVSLFVYAWCRKVHSSRKIAALCRDDVGGRIIGGGYLPDHRTVNNFRLRHEAALNGLFKQSIKLCERAGLVGMTTAALDGSKIPASASKRKAMSYERLVAEEARVQAEIDGYFKRAAEEDAADDAQYGADNEGPCISEELKRRQTRITKIREAKTALEMEAQAAAEQKQKERSEKEAAAAACGKKVPGKKPRIDAAPKPTAQRSFTDPESRIMKSGNGSFIQGYNAQAMVDGKCQVIVACELSQQAADVGHLPAMLVQTKENLGALPEKVLADPGYFSEENMAVAKEMGVVALIPPDRERCGSPYEPAVELSEAEMSNLSPAEQMRHLVSTRDGRDAYRNRKGIVEPVFGQAKGCAGHPGFLGFLRRGYEKCSAEWQWVCASHNILKYIRHRPDRPGGAASPAGPNRPKRTKIASPETQMALAGGW